MVAELRSGEKNSKLVNVTINLPEVYLWNIDKLVGYGLFHSRSEAVRAAIKEFLEKEIENLDLFDAKTVLERRTLKERTLKERPKGDS